MATKRERTRADGSTYWQVRFRADGKETSECLDAEQDAEVFRQLVDKVGGARAREIHGLQQRTRTNVTVTKWLGHHIEHLSGIERRTRHEYLGVVKNDIAPTIGAIPLDLLTRDDISRWVEKMRGDGAAGKTIANKHGLLSAALDAAVRAGHITANPAASVRLPRTERPEMRFLTHEEFATLLSVMSQRWQPMLRFMVASGARLSEVTSLRPADVDRAGHTVRISRAWKRNPGGYELGPPKTRKSVRTINIPADILDDLDYTGAWLFTNAGLGNRNPGGFVRPHNFRLNVWWPALGRAELAPPRPRIHDLRHTCASWLIQAGIPLPVIQQHLGHESIKTTIDCYGHLDRASGQAAAAAIGRALTTVVVPKPHVTAPKVEPVNLP